MAQQEMVGTGTENVSGLNLQPNKSEQIEKWKQSIKKLNKKIDNLMTDKNLSDLERQRKIAKCREIIANYEQTIKSASEFIAYQKAKIYETYNKHITK